MNKMLILSSVMIFALLTGCQSTKIPVIDIKSDIEVIQDIYLPCSKVAAGDLEGWLSDFNDDVVYIPWTMHTLRGKNALRMWAIDTFNDYEMDETIEIEKIGISGDLAYILFTYSLHADSKSGGEQINDAGRCINILERQSDGSWKIKYHISNSTSNYLNQQ